MTDRDRGSTTLELVVLVPGLLLVIGLLVVGGRMAVAHTAVQSASSDAARSASLARSAGQAQAEAGAAAQTALAADGLQCSQTSVLVDTSGFTVPVGEPAAVTATVSCTVRLSDLVLPGLGGDRAVRASTTSPLDTYRER